MIVERKREPSSRAPSLFRPPIESRKWFECVSIVVVVAIMMMMMMSLLFGCLSLATASAASASRVAESEG